MCGRWLSGTWAGAGTLSVDSACGDGHVELPDPAGSVRPGGKVSQSRLTNSGSAFASLRESFVRPHLPSFIRDPAAHAYNAAVVPSSCAKTLSDIKVGAHGRVNLV